MAFNLFFVEDFFFLCLGLFEVDDEDEDEDEDADDNPPLEDRVVGGARRFRDTRDFFWRHFLFYTWHHKYTLEHIRNKMYKMYKDTSRDTNEDEEIGQEIKCYNPNIP